MVFHRHWWSGSPLGRECFLSGLDDHCGNLVRITVGCGSAVFQTTFQPSWMVPTGIRIDAHGLILHSWICRSIESRRPVELVVVTVYRMWRSMFCPNSSQIFLNNSSPPSSRIAAFEKFACIRNHSSRLDRFGWKIDGNVVIFCSTLRMRANKFGHQRILPLAKIWYSHWPIITSALIPSTFNPASKHKCKCSSTKSRPLVLRAPTEVSRVPEAQDILLWENRAAS